MTNVFQQIPDKRQVAKIQYSLHEMLMSAFACMYFQDPSLLQFQARMKQASNKSNLETLFHVKNIPKETQMREVIDQVDSEGLASIFKEFYSLLRRHKHLEQYQLFPNLYYFPMDGTEFFNSNEIHCNQCLTKEYKEGEKTYSHQVLQGGIMHPNMNVVIPFMPEQICNDDGEEKQDCEMNAAKRLISKLRKSHSQLGFIIGGDALFSKQPIIEEILSQKMHYIFAAKPSDHTYLFDWIDGFEALHRIEFQDEKGRTHIYEWMNDVPLNGKEKSISVNFFRCQLVGKKNKKSKEKVLYKNSWVSDLVITKDTICTMVKGARCRWKNENECFNVMKNHGYYMDRNYGHGKKNLCFNFYLLTLLAFFCHQIAELTDLQYQACRKQFGSKRHLWENLRAQIRLFIFESWEQLLCFTLEPKETLVTWACAP